MGFTRVYDYEAGKGDWFAAGLPREGRSASLPRAGDVARHDDVTCGLTDSLGNVAGKTREAGKDACIVTTSGGVVLGRVPGKALDGDPDALVEAIMDAGPTTVRTNEPLEPLYQRMVSRNVESLLVTTSDGRLVGSLYRADVERTLNGDASSREEDEASCVCSV
ncbi:MAG: CBS domain-containing protein [Chloroflexi bacterium]|nr:CBS domain-containing protein [Chloroflexota bacterium]